MSVILHAGRITTKLYRYRECPKGCCSQSVSGEVGMELHIPGGKFLINLVLKIYSDVG
jgi:hypothetical protein